VTQSQATAAKIITTLTTGTIRTLRSTSRILERTADSLESQSFDRLNPIVSKIVGGVTIAGRRFLPIWHQGLKLIRDRLPTDLNGKLSDRALSGIVAGAIVILFWFTSSLFSSKPPQPIPIATRPPLMIPTEPTQFPSDLSAPESAPEIVSAPVEAPIAQVPIEPVETPNVEPKTAVVEPAIEPAVEVSPVQPIVEAPPEIELAPEQKQIAAIESQVMEISDRFISGLVIAVEPNRDRLKVRVSEDWYRFNPEQQDRFANELWARSQTLDLNKLEITDSQGTLLARPPIVGDSMVILKRKSTIA
jgi:hypothetical protein